MQSSGGGGIASGGVLHNPGALTLNFGLPQDGTMVQHQGQGQMSPHGSSGVKIEEAHSTTNMNQQTHNPELENQKKAIYRHPLFPLMALLFEKCEQATQTPDCPSTDSFDVDIQAFVHHQEQDCKPFFSDDPEMDGLMVKTIQVLRIHLLELEKVNDLCKDFCARYTSCLKGKLQSDNLLRVEGSNVLDPDSTAPDLDGSLGPGQVVSGGTVFQMVQTAQGLVAQPVQMQGQSPVSSPNAVQGNTPLAQIGLSSPQHQVNNMSVSSPALGSPSDFDDDDFNGRKSKRGVLPKQATLVMKSWLFQHIVHPYPTEDEKRHIASQTNLTLLQVNNWFINARRRILQPMLDASNPEAGNKAKKSKSTSRPPQRFWPGNLASLQHASSQASSPSSTTLDQDMQSDEDGFDDDEDEEDDDDDSVGLPTPQQLTLPPGVSVTGDGQLVPSSSLSLLAPPASSLPSYSSHHQPYLSPPTNQLANS